MTGAVCGGASHGGGGGAPGRGGGRGGPHPRAGGRGGGPRGPDPSPGPGEDAVGHQRQDEEQGRGPERLDHEPGALLHGGPSGEAAQNRARFTSAIATPWRPATSA